MLKNRKPIKGQWKIDLAIGLFMAGIIIYVLINI